MTAIDRGRAFLDESARYLTDVYMPRMARALQVLPTGDLWWRPHDGALSFATILLHLEGNVRQWIVCGLGGAPDARDRASEFAATDGPDGTALLARLSETVAAAATILRQLDAGDLSATRSIQGDEHDVQAAIYHVIEHFSWHTGQAVWIAKARAGASHDVHFYDDDAVNKLRNG